MLTRAEARFLLSHLGGDRYLSVIWFYWIGVCIYKQTQIRSHILSAHKFQHDGLVQPERQCLNNGLIYALRLLRP